MKFLKSISSDLIIGILILLAIMFLRIAPVLLGGVIALLVYILIAKEGNLINKALFIAFSILATIAEAIITKSGAWVYSQPAVFGLPLWLPFAWGASAIIAHHIFQIFHPHHRDEKRKLKLSFEIILYVFCIYLSATYYGNPFYVLLTTAGILIINIFIHHPKEEFFFIFYFFIIGFLAELLGTQYEIWKYGSDSRFLQIFWMAIMYSQFALMARRIAFAIAYVPDGIAAEIRSKNRWIKWGLDKI